MFKKNYILAFDSSNETIAIAIGKISSDNTIDIISTTELKAHRASNTLLIPKIDKLLNNCHIHKRELRIIAAGRGPGSFTGVRICLSTAKGIASSLEAGLIGVSTLDSIAWNAWANNVRGHLYVTADAMRKEVYPVLYCLNSEGIERLNSDCVIKATTVADNAKLLNKKYDDLIICGDGLYKYSELFKEFNLAKKTLWDITGNGLLLNLQKQWQTSQIDLNNPQQYNPGSILPVYTRLSDAEENERTTTKNKPNLVSGVQATDIKYRPAKKSDASDIYTIDKLLMGTDSWTEKQFCDDFSIKSRSWWIAQHHNKIIAYAGALSSGKTGEILKIAVDKKYHNRGIAKNLLNYVANDLRDLGCTETYLEVRKSNHTAIKFYKACGLEVFTTRNKYYSDGEDAYIMRGPLPILNKHLAGMNIQDGANSKDIDFQTSELSNKEIILAIESSCDETAAAIMVNGKIIADEVASQIDYHKRFGGVVPEIASRKHIEAISGLVDICFENASMALNRQLKWKDLSAIAVTYAPGLVGALVVGMAFAKGAAWGATKPLVGVNHLEGHLYANKLASDNHKITMPAIASIVSGGNTMLVHVKSWGKYSTLGTTIDDAVGEAFDKVAKALGLGYPGGPIISKYAEKGNPKAIHFPRAMMNSGDLRFSLSGLKTSVMTYIQKETAGGKKLNYPDICASFQQAVIDVQVEKAKTALLNTNSKTFMFGGGVAANPQLRKAYKTMCKKIGVELIMAPLSACGDNAAMIALVAKDRFNQGKFFAYDSDVMAHAALDNDY